MILLLLELYDFVLGLDDVLQHFGVVVVEVDGLFLGIPHLHLLLDVQRGSRWRPRQYSG